MSLRGEQMDELIQVENLKKYFKVKGKILKAVDDVSFAIPRKTTFSLVGESGCGKTTCGRTIMGMYDVTQGNVFYKGNNIQKMNAVQKKEFHKNAQMIFQDPYSCLDPRMNVETIISEGRKVHFKESAGNRKEIVRELLEKVGLPALFAARFPHELSGGQRQRVGIARALAVNPEFIVCDEPIAALDVSIQAQVINLLMDLQEQQKLTYLFISHDLAIVRHISDEIGVMYLGNLIEKGTTEEIFTHPLHPYTKALFSSVMRGQIVDGKKVERIVLKGELPSPMNAPSGCRFRTRCPYATSQCAECRPKLKNVADRHQVSCLQY